MQNGVLLIMVWTSVLLPLTDLVFDERKDGCVKRFRALIELCAHSYGLHQVKVCADGSEECWIGHVFDPLFPTHIFDDGGDLRVMDMTDPREQMMHDLHALHLRRAAAPQMMGWVLGS